MATGHPTRAGSLPFFPEGHIPQGHQSPTTRRLPLSPRALELCPGTLHL